MPYGARRSPARSSFLSTNQLANIEVQVEGRGVVLLSDDDQGRALGRPDGHGCRAIEEVLVGAEPSVRVARKGGDGLVLRADHAGNREVALREWHPYRGPDPDADVEQAQEDADGEHEKEEAATTPATPVAIPPAWPTLAHRRKPTQSRPGCGYQARVTWGSQGGRANDRYEHQGGLDSIPGGHEIAGVGPAPPLQGRGRRHEGGGDQQRRAATREGHREVLRLAGCRGQRSRGAGQHEAGGAIVWRCAGRDVSRGRRRAGQGSAAEA